VAALAIKRELGSIHASELLLRELYVDLRKALAAWSQVTRQTPQARMGYIGQHLTSVVTGYPGGRSGARGDDLVLPKGEFAEIKTCSRVDQLGSCLNCGARVSAIEEKCPECGSDKIRRMEDSKWLIGIKNDKELAELFIPKWYYLVLFDLEQDQSTISARIWRVNPRHPGFALCMIDYYFNIKAKSASGAPFDFWPYSPKFYLMHPWLVYHSRILPDNSIATLLFDGQTGSAKPDPFPPFPDVSRARSITNDAWMQLASGHQVAIDGTPRRGEDQRQMVERRLGGRAFSLCV